MEFTSFETPKSAHAGKRDILFVDEANNIEYEIYFQLAIRTTKQIFLSYNPSEKFWVHDKLIGKPDTKLIISDHRHNHFLSEEKHNEIENIPDKSLHEVYARGKTGDIKGIIYPGWQKVPDSHFPWDADKFFFGLDFGFTNDPTAIVKCVLMGDSLYCHELAYTPGLPVTYIKQILFGAGCNNYTPVYADHSPEMISQLRRLGISCMAARKGQGSLKAGIEALRNLKVYYTASSANIHYERQRYVFITDKTTQQITNVPIDQFNHTLDAIRMAYFSQKFRVA
jgi:phage terminase large subunit